MRSACLPQQALLKSHIIENGFQLQANNDQIGINSFPDQIIEQQQGSNPLAIARPVLKEFLLHIPQAGRVAALIELQALLPEHIELNRRHRTLIDNNR